MTQITKKKTGYENAKLWRDSQQSASTTDPVIYIFIGNSVPWSNESSPPALVDSIFEEKATWDNMYAAKKITGGDAELVIPKVTWASGNKYIQFDDTTDANTLVSANTTRGVQPMYVITSQKNVYKCVSNNTSTLANTTNSTVEPTGDYTTSNGNISTADGYLWKYMYNVKPSNKFLTTNFMPTPTSTSQLDYGVDNTGVVDGELTTVTMTNAGSGYKDSIVTTTAFVTGCTRITLANTTNISANMTVAGTGIFAGSTIKSIIAANNTILLSTGATANGGASGNNITVSTRVSIDGDGTGALASHTLVSGAITKITVSTIGTGYSTANAAIYGSGSSATARVIIGPKYGHAYNPGNELGAGNVMNTIRLGEIDSTEGGLISPTTSFRQVGLLINPHKYSNTSAVSHTTANSVIKQATTLTVIAGTVYTLNEYVYQGSSAATATFFGYLNYQQNNELWLTRVKGKLTVGLPLIGATSGSSRTVITSVNPEFEPYSGDIVYTENAVKTDRTDGQAENIKLVIRF